MVHEFIRPEDRSLFVSGANFTLGAMYYEEGMEETMVTYDLYVRELPAHRNYLVFAGLESILDYLRHLRFTNEQMSFLRRSYSFSNGALAYFKKFRFTGEVWAMPEGTIFFPDEPVIRITAPIIEAQFVERYLINTVMVHTVLASKIARFADAAQGIKTGVNFTRAHGIQASLIGLRSAEIVGVDIVSMPYRSFIYNRPTESGGTTHAFIKSFRSEEEALRVFSKHSHGKGWWLADTFDLTRGMQLFARVVRELKLEGKPYPRAVLVDSGDLATSYRIARRTLDRMHLHDITVGLMSNLDEYKVEALRKKGIHPAMFAGGTELVTSPDAPKLEVVYKMSEMRSGNEIIPTMKLAQTKRSLPGKKQVYRIQRGGKNVHDIITLAHERSSGDPLLKRYMHKGKLARTLPTMDKIRQYYRAEKKHFTSNLFNINRSVRYTTVLSSELKKLIRKTIQRVEKSYGQ